MILVACIGNIFLGDDGFGVEVARQLSSRPLPPHVVVKDFGVRGFDLAYALLDHKGLAILVDACPRGGEPGTVYLIEPEPDGLGGIIGAGEAIGLPETHSMNPMRVLAMVRAMRESERESAADSPNRILLVGCEPQDFGPENEGRMGLSDPVHEAVQEAVTMIERVIHEHTERSENAQGIEHICR
jgi:hydrogenase maturation protease